MNKFSIGGIVAALALAFGNAQAAVTTFTDEASFLAAAGAGLTQEGFETATQSTPTSVSFGGGTFSCSGSAWCPGFFGVSSTYAKEGTHSVFFASPDTSTFTFNSPISAFGIFIGGAGNVGAITLNLTTSSGETVTALNNFIGPDVTQPGGFDPFIGLIKTDGFFTGVTFTPSNDGDGIFFDRMSYGTAAVPEPGTLALLGIAACGLGGLRRRKG